MSVESPRSSVFTFQSAVHSSHVLQCLDDQRQRDVLCDVTVVADGRSFRAHRSVLASCSDYFSARVFSHVGRGFIISLPDEVTVEGFEPLLQFAYTAKLLFTKDNVLEIRNCAAILGFKNLDKACFEFLLPKFFDSSKSAAKISRKSCCKSKCCKSGKPVSDDIADNDTLDSSPVFTETASLFSPVVLDEKDTACSTSKLPEDACGSSSGALGETDAPTIKSLLCPKYRKFQNACGRERSCVDVCSWKTTPTPVDKDPCPLNCPPCASAEDHEASPVPSSGESVLQPDPEGVAMPFCPLSTLSLCAEPKPISSDTQTSISSCDDDCVGGKCAQGEACDGDDRSLEVAGVDEGSPGQSLQPTELSAPTPSPVPEEQAGKLREEQRSTVEREVAEHLAKGFWPDLCSSSASPPLPGAIAVVLKQLSTGTASCPCLRDTGPVDAQLPGREGASRSEESPFISALHLSGEDSDSFDTEGDSESYTSERAREIQLPFAVDRIASLGRNDFQQMLKLQCLTREQLDFVHDVRRRSKNRIAARRCRKRKLDCIYNLECEIEKLRSQKEKLMTERSQLSQMKARTWQSYSGLYERVCSEAALRPEQLQVLAKYTSSDCPLSVLISPLAAPPACPAPPCPAAQLQSPGPTADFPAGRGSGLQPLAGFPTAEPTLGEAQASTQTTTATPSRPPASAVCSLQTDAMPAEDSSRVSSVSPDPTRNLQTDL